MSRVVLAMSGGVDSSVAAWLLREAGHDVVGLFMRHGQEFESAAGTSARPRQGCCSATDAADARRVAEMLGIPFYAVNFQQEFARIVDYFVESYTTGRTPNPCIVCNTRLKFGRLFEYADSVGAEFVATGHYARLVGTPKPPPLAPLAGRGAGGEGCSDGFVVPGHEGDIALCRAVDPSKDQSYVLFGIQRRLLPRLKFPLGDHRKEEIRRIAGRLGLRVAGKRDSQEICFVPDQDHARFVRQRRGDLDASGEIVTTDGTVVGRHAGLEGFTIGQRRGLGIAFGEPRYVVRIEPETRRVVIGPWEELTRWELTAAEANWLVDEPAGPLLCQVKIRYRSRPVEATVEALPAGRFRVRFTEPCHGIAPGQAAVCYNADRVLGGGWIE
jgi:tRNA-specific 2-thiouridylase